FRKREIFGTRRLMAPSFAWTLPQAGQLEWHLSAVGDEPEGSVDRQLAGFDESALVEACLAGQPGAFDLIVERHRRTVYRLCSRFVGNQEDAADLAQEVFIRAYRGLRNFRKQSSLSTWLYRIGVNVCLNRVHAKPLPTEPLDKRQHVDTRDDSPADL